ncbi:sulfite exporter TauE/SafE family protein [Salsipaludibacter albus]|uniref:sulfite exporter TauE/SafE family protein n=1 Tax=Salsipaludibacter albus TaxID=2849650 RepID=UPI001EE46418|nr:sulfite exporter TauE/SafE family protein [Salsipaludibacter albus]MBY5163053.1 sulfite exporter TauE/SafE family protein [Salsipaludibacter albus]
MTLVEQVVVLLAGIGAGTINTIVGSGTLITFPVLVLLGVPPLTANVSNTVGLVPGAISGTWGYRRELQGQGRRLWWLGGAGLAGGLVGAVALLVAPAGAFDAVVPVLIVLALVAVVAQPRVAERLATRPTTGPPGRPRLVLLVGVFLTGIYGGYFGAAQGVLLLALLGMTIAEDLQRLNATKNLVATLVNGVAAVVFVAVAEVDWRVAVLIAIGSVVGGQVGATVGRRLSPVALRAVIVVVGLLAVVRLVTT